MCTKELVAEAQPHLKETGKEGERQTGRKQENENFTNELNTAEQNTQKQ